MADGCDHAEPLIALADGDASIIPPVVIEVLDTILALPEDRQNEALSKIVRELTPDHISLIRKISATTIIYQVVVEKMSFTAWLASGAGRWVSGGSALAAIAKEDQDWPNFHTYAQLRDYVSERHPLSLRAFDTVWEHYSNLIISPQVSTTSETMYAAMVRWSDGYEELHPDTAAGVSRTAAGRRADDYNGEIRRYKQRDVPSEQDLSSRAYLVCRTGVYGPWHAVGLPER